MKKLAKTAGALGLVGCAVMSSPYALADDSKKVDVPNWYIGGSIGQSRATIDDARITSQLLSGLNATMADSNKHFAYKLFGGHQFNKNFALEGGYFNLGQFGYTATTVPAGSLTGNIKLQGLNFDAVGILPVADKFSLLARGGLIYAQAKDNFTSSGAVATPAAPSPSQNALSYKFGVGAQYDFNKSLAMRIEGERYRVKDAVGNNGDINLASIGLIYRFDEKKPVEKAKPVPVVVPVKVKYQEYCSILDIQFEIKKDEIQREEKEKLASVGTFMTKYPNTTAVIEGHSDNVGTEDFNMQLSQRRADSVVKYLVDELHIDPARLSAVGYGETRPIADNDTIEGRQANRRIDAVIACAKDVAGLKVAPTRVTMAMEMEFDPYKSEIEPQYLDALREVANFMKANPTVTATIEGHSARRAGAVRISPEEAMQISETRAQTVADYLVYKEGISRSRISTEGFGSTRLVAYGTSLDGQQEDRRVNIIFNYAK